MVFLLVVLAALFALGVAQSGQRPIFEEQHEDFAFQEFDSVNIFCNASGNPEPTYWWFTEKSVKIPILKEGNASIYCYEYRNGMSLIIPSIQMEHAGRYTCSGWNSYGMMAKEYNITVHRKEGPPTFSKNYETVKIEEGEYSEVICSASGYPRPTYHWFDQSKREINYRNPNLSVHNYENMSVLIFHSALQNHSGLYNCIANNSYGEASMHFNISVYSEVGLPFFDKPNDTVVIPEGKYNEVLCSARGKPAPNYTWTDEHDNLIEGNKKYLSLNVVKRDNGSALIFNVANTNHSGIYKCSARNSYGQRTKYYSISVDSNGNETSSCRITRVATTRVGESSVSFSVDVAGYYHSILVRYSEKLSSNASYIRWNRFDNFVVNNLLPSGVYTFEFQPEAYLDNCTEWQRNTTVTLLPSEPEVILRSLAGDTLIVEWKRVYDDSRRDSIYKYTLSYHPLTQHGDEWVHSDCITTVNVPTCFGNVYKLAGMQSNNYYHLEVAAHTSAGRGTPYQQKIYIAS